MLLAIIAATLLLPIGTALAVGETSVIPAFVYPLVFVWAAAAALYFPGRKKKMHMSVRGGFAMVAVSWIAASILGAVPLMLSGYITNPADAFFESVSGFTTTGATILSDIENLPRSLNLWRCQMHWLGGMGIVALTVALFPLLGVGGFQLIKAETTGPEKGKVTPKIAETAKMLWFIYLGMTVIQTALLRLAGMPFIDSLAHTFATLGTGGFSMMNASVAAYGSAAVDWICTVFMILAGVNFSLYYRLLTGRGRELAQNTELKAYLGIIIVSVTAVVLIISPLYDSFLDAVRYAAFQVASIITTTGFATANYDLWPAGAQLVLFFLMFIGACSGSTAGGIKVIRWVILGKQASCEMGRALHPHGVFSIRLNGRAGRKDIVYSAAAFVFVYFLLVLITTFAAAAGGADSFSSFTASLALVGNIGPGFGMVGPIHNYGFFADWTKWWFSFAMIAGRLELYTMIIFFMPSFWKK